MLKNTRLKRTGLVILTIIGLAVLPAVSAQAVCPEDIFARWTLDETGLTPGAVGGAYADAIKDNDGTGNFNPTAATGRVGGAQLFNGANTKINVQGDNSFDWQADESFSIEFWMKTDGLSTPADNQIIIGRAADPQPGLFWWVGVHGGDGLAAFTLRGANNVGNNIPGGGTVNLADGDWHHVVAIRDTVQDKIILYVDGATDPTLEAADTTTAGFEGGARSLNIGWLNNGSGFFFDGLIDEVALYDRVLSAAEIDEHYNNRLGKDICDGVAPFVPFPDDTISIWQLDETGLTPGAVGGAYADAFDGNDGTGNFNPTAATGRVGGAQLFNGANTKINVQGDNSFDWQADESFSIEFWMKTDGLSTPADNQIIIGRAADPQPGLFWWVGVHGGDGLAAFTLRGANNVGNNIPGGGTVNLADGGWHHVVAIRDTVQDKIILYVDGATDPTLEAADTTTAGFEGGARSLNIGWLNNGSGFFFDGLIDEVALYDRVLSADEITAHRNAGLAVPGMGVESLRAQPLADAGGDKTVQEGATVTLDGVNSDDAPGAIVSFLWEQVGTPVVTLSGAATQTATFTAPDVAAGGTLVLSFQLTVTDNDGLIDTDTVTITVNDSSVAPPVTPAGGGGGGGGCFISTMF